MAFVATSDSGFRIVLEHGFVVKPESTFMCGFHGLGEVGFLSTAHLTRVLDARRVGFIKSDMLPSFVSMENGRLTLPFEIYSHEKLVFLVPRFQPHQSEQWHFVDQLANWIVQQGFSEVLLLGGLDINFREEQDQSDMRCVPTTAYLPRMAKWNIPLLEEGLFVAGPLALLLAEMEMRNYPAIGLLTYATRGRPDPGSAAIMLNKINQVYGLNANVDQLIEESKEIERLEKMRRSIEPEDRPADMFF